MSLFKGIPIVEPRPARSGEKYVTPQGFTAIKDGIKPNAAATGASTAEVSTVGTPGLGRKPPWLRARAPMRRRVRTGQGNRPRTSAEHRLRGSQVSEHRRVLERRDGDDHADGRRLHARLPVLRGGHRQSARLARSGRARERRSFGRVDGPEVCRAHLGRPGRLGGRRSRSLRGGDPRHQTAQSARPPSRH